MKIRIRNFNKPPYSVIGDGVYHLVTNKIEKRKLKPKYPIIKHPHTF